MSILGKRKMWLAVAGVVLAGISAGQASAQSSINYSGGNYTQTFDSLPNSQGLIAEGSGFGPFDITGAPWNVMGVEGWFYGAVSSSSSSPSPDLRADAGGGVAGAAYSYGADGSTERAFGQLASGAHVGTIGAFFTNNSSETFTSFTLSYTGEQWRKGNNAILESLIFSYGVGAMNVASKGTVFEGLNFTALQNSTSTAAPLDGNDSANRLAISTTVGGLTWAPGETLYIRWDDTDNASSDDGLAIDDLTFSAAAGSVGKTLIWNPPGDVWNSEAGNTNWLDGVAASAFAAGDNVEFTDAGLGAGATVNIDSSGVSPGSASVSNTTGTYTFTNGPIMGSSSLTKTGAGTLVLASDNTYTGGTKLGEGTISIASGNALGTGSLTFDAPGGTLRVTGPINRTAGIATSAGATGVIITDADATFGDYSGAGNLEKRGPGRLTLEGGVTSTGITRISEGTLALAQPSGVVALRFDDASALPGAGSLDIINNIRLNIAGSFASTPAGGGAVRILTSGATIGAVEPGAHGISAPIQLNANGVPAPFNAGFTANSGATLEIAGPISGDANVTFGPVSGSGGLGTVMLAVPATYSGATVLNLGHQTQATGNVGLLRLGAHDALPVGTSLTFGVGDGNAGALDMNGFDQSIVSLGNAGTGNYNGITNIGATTSTLTITGAETTTFSGPIGKLTAGDVQASSNDNIALVLSPEHTGTLKLTGANTYAGGTQINGGTLLIGGAVPGTSATGTGPVNIATAARLGGSGRVAGPVTTAGPSLSMGGTIAPGENGPGIIEINGGLDLSSGGTYEWGLSAFSVNTPGTDYDQILWTGGDLNLSGPSRLSVVFDAGVTDPNGGNVFWNTPHSWKVLEASSAGTASGSFATLLNGDFGAGDFTVRSGQGADLGDVFLDYEPSVLAVLIWDGNGVSVAGPSDVSGNWTDPDLWWTAPAGGTPGNASWDSNKPDAALFGTGTGGTGAVTVTIPTSVTASSVAFSGNSPVYTIAGGTLHLQGDAETDVVADNTSIINSAVVLGGPQSWVTNGAATTLIVNGAISGAHGITKSGAGSLALGNTGNSFSSLTITQGDVLASNDGHLGAPGSAVTLDGGRLMTSAPFVSNRDYVIGSSGGEFNTWGGELTVNGQVSGPGALAISGSFPVVLTGINSFNGATVIADGLLAVTSDDSLGAPGSGVSLTDGGTLSLRNSMTTARTITLLSGGGTVHVPSSQSTLAGLIEGTEKLTKTGAGTLILTNNAIPTPRQGITDIQAGVVRIAAVDPLENTSALGTGLVNVLGGGTLEIANVNLGLSTETSAGQILLHNGGTLLGTGNASYGRSSGALRIVNGTVDAPNVVNIRTGAATDVLTLKSSQRQATSGSGDTHATIVVGGPGKVVLESGGTTSLTGFAGSWQLDGGILQLGPVSPGGFGEPLNALGQKNGSLNDINLANPIQINGGILVGAADEKNPLSSAAVPPYFRNAITLAGGAIASSKHKVDGAGNPTDVPVNANFGGHFTVTGTGASRVLVYDPVDATGARDVNLVGAGDTTWQGILEIEPESASVGGSFNLNRTGGTVSVDPGALIIVKNGASLRLNGVDATSEAAGEAVDVQNDSAGSVLVETGTHRIGNLDGAGTVTVAGGATLAAKFIRQSAATIAGTATIAPNGTNAGTSDVGSLVIAGDTDAWTGTLDLRNNDLVIRTPGGAARDTAYATAVNQVKSGLNAAGGVFWTGNGIQSSAAAAESGGILTAVGIILNDFAQVPGLPAGPIMTEFSGRTVSENDILLKYTWFGDADLSGVVDATDYSLIDNAFNLGLVNGGWLNGDFDFNGVVDATDYSLIDNAFNSQTVALGGGAAASAVPEPSLAGLLLGAGLLARRRRNPKMSEPMQPRGRRLSKIARQVV